MNPSTSVPKTRVLLVDDNEAMLVRARAVLTPRCEIVGAVTCGTQALHVVRDLQPDVLVLDISMPTMTGFEVVARLRESGQSPAVVFLTVHDEEEVMQAARQAGGLGYVVKPRLVSDLAHAVSEARAGRPFHSTIR